MNQPNKASVFQLKIGMRWLLIHWHSSIGILVQSHESNGTELAVSSGANLISSGHFQMPYDIVRDGA